MKRAIERIGITLLLASGLFAAQSEVADAAMEGNTAAVRALLGKKAEVNAPQVDGATALHWAVQANNLEMIEMLLRAGAFTNTPAGTATTKKSSPKGMPVSRWYRSPARAQSTPPEASLPLP